MKTKSLTQFIREHRQELTQFIGERLSFVPATAGCFCHRKGTNHFHETPPINDKDRREWIRSDESLYNWARSEGVNI